MAIRRVREVGDPILRSRSQEVPDDLIRSSDLQRLIDDMVETMRDYDGVGIAAPQVGESWRVFAMEVRDGPRSVELPPLGLTIVVNPVVVHESGESEDSEGCLSIEGLRGDVPRPQMLEVAGADRFGEPWSTTLEGYHARIFQHELDHLDGGLYVDRMRTMQSLTTLRLRERWRQG